MPAVSASISAQIPIVSSGSPSGTAPLSSRLATSTHGFRVRSESPRSTLFASSNSPASLRSVSEDRAAWAISKVSTWALASCPRPLSFRRALSRAVSTTARSAMMSSAVTSESSPTGSWLGPKARRTTHRASASRSCPSPWAEVPPGTSTNRTCAGTIFFDPSRSAKAFSRWSGTGTTARLARPPAAPALVSEVKSVDFPEYGTPTRPMSFTRRPGPSYRSTGMAEAAEFDRPRPALPVGGRLEAQQATLLTARQKDGEARVFRRRPQVLSLLLLEAQERHRVIARPIQRQAPLVVTVDPAEPDEARSRVDQQRLARLRPRLAEEAPSFAVLGGLDGPRDLPFHRAEASHFGRDRWRPWRRRIASFSGSGNTSRYGRSLVMAWNASQTKTMRASRGMASPARPSGYPFPPQRSWQALTIGRISWRSGTGASICSPISGWRFMIPRSAVPRARWPAL